MNLSSYNTIFVPVRQRAYQHPLQRGRADMARIREVWAPNLEAEMRIIWELVDSYPYIAMVRDPVRFLQLLTLISVQDTEFPGVVARPIGTFKTSSDYHYQTMRCNVDLLKIIQLGITLANDEGQLPQECSTWQFNFKFSLT
jgi:CCR4-NOT transcription complex subunit 7/8